MRPAKRKQNFIPSVLLQKMIREGISENATWRSEPGRLAGVQDGHVRLYRSWVAGISIALESIFLGTHTIVPSDCLFAQCEKKSRQMFDEAALPGTAPPIYQIISSSPNSQKEKTYCHHQHSQRQAGCPNGPKEKDTSRQTPRWAAGSSDGFGEHSYQQDWPSHQGTQGIHPSANHRSN